MMGHRTSSAGIEVDAFFRAGRRALHWRPGELRKIKRQLAKRLRKGARADARQCASANHNQKTT